MRGACHYYRLPLWQCQRAAASLPNGSPYKLYLRVSLLYYHPLDTLLCISNFTVVAFIINLLAIEGAGLDPQNTYFAAIHQLNTVRQQ